MQPNAKTNTAFCGSAWVPSINIEVAVAAAGDGKTNVDNEVSADLAMSMLASFTLHEARQELDTVYVAMRTRLRLGLKYSFTVNNDPTCSTKMRCMSPATMSTSIDAGALVTVVTGSDTVRLNRSVVFAIAAPYDAVKASVGAWRTAD